MAKTAATEEPSRERGGARTGVQGSFRRYSGSTMFGFLLVLLTLSISGLASAQQITATVDRNEITFDEQILLQIRIEGAQVGRPVLPEMAGFTATPRGQETSMSVVNGQMSRSVAFNYILVPRQVGEFQLGPFEVEIDGQIHRTRPFKVKVREPSESPAETQDYFLRVRVSDTRPFVGEQVVYTWRFYRRVNITDARLEPLDFGDLLVEEIGGGEVRDFQTTLNGMEYLVSEIRRALFAQREGPVTIAPSALTVSVPMQRTRRRRSLFDDLMGRVPVETRVVHSNSIELDVRPVPSPPPEFTGLVGDYNVSTAVSRNELAVGESVTLEVTVTGKGNVHQISPPTLGDLSDFKVYDDPVKSNYDRSGGALKGSKTYRKSLVPVQSGTLTIPQARVVFFDPEREEFRTATTPAIALDVAPGEGAEDLRLTESVSPGTGKVAVRVLADDIQPIERDLESLDPDALRGWRAIIWGASWLGPPILFLGLVLVRRRRLRYELDRGLRRRQMALKRARASIDKLDQENQPAEQARRASRLVREFVGDKLGVEGTALTPMEVEALLLGHGVAESASRRTRQVLDRLEAAQYGGAGDVEAAIKVVASLISTLNKNLNGGGRMQSRGLGSRVLSGEIPSSDLGAGGGS